MRDDLMVILPGKPDLASFAQTPSKSVSALATNGHVLDKSKTNPLENSSGFVLDMSVGGKCRHGFVRIWHVLDMS